MKESIETVTKLVDSTVPEEDIVVIVYGKKSDIGGYKVGAAFVNVEPEGGLGLMVHAIAAFEKEAVEEHIHVPKQNNQTH